MNSPLIKNRSLLAATVATTFCLLSVQVSAQTSWSPFRPAPVVQQPVQPKAQTAQQVQRAQFVQRGARSTPTPARAGAPARISTVAQSAQQPTTTRVRTTAARQPANSRAPQIIRNAPRAARAPQRVAQAPTPAVDSEYELIPHPNGEVIQHYGSEHTFDEVLEGNTPIAPMQNGGMEFMPGGCDGNCGGSCGGATCAGGGCATGNCGTGDCYTASCGTGQVCITLCAGLPWCEFEFETGVQGFTGPQNLGAGGSFGFQQAVNYSRSFPDFFNLFGPELGMQVGFRTVQTDFSPSNLTTSGHNQTFFTAGLFHRVDWGLQFGGVVDYMTDRWYVNTNLSQFRGEVSWKFQSKNEFGFRMTANGSTRTGQRAVVGVPVNRASVFNTSLVNQYLFFYRTPVANSGEFTAFAGLSDNRDGIFGSNIEVPLNNSFAVRGGFTYLTPSSSTALLGTPGTAVSVPGSARENWNVSLSLVWYPCGFGQKRSNYNNALFNVGDNGSLLMNRTIR